MNIVICGAGEVGRHAAEVLGAANDNITIIDRDPDKLDLLEEVLDVRVMVGNGVHAEDLREAGCKKADLFIAATSRDEVNLLAASIAKAVGAKRAIARVHHSDYFESKGINYAEHLGIDHLVCPEHTTAVAIAQTLRNPGALAVEHFARGKIEMQQFQVSDNASAVGKPLMEVTLPKGVRLAAIEREKKAFIPDAQTVIQPGDVATLVGDVTTFEAGRKLFHTEATRRKRVMLVGGSTLAVWLCRALHKHNIAIRLFEADAKRADELAGKLGWVTVIRVDPTDTSIYEEERIDQADAFVAVSDDDEQNILSAARAKTMGVRNAVAVLQRPTYLHLLEHIGIDHSFSPRVTAVTQIQHLIDESSVRHLASLAIGVADVFEVRVPEKGSEVVDKPLREIEFPPRTIVAAIQRGEDVHVPNATDTIEAGDTAVIIAPAGTAKQIQELFGIK